MRVVIDHLGTTKGRGATAAVPFDEAAWALDRSRATSRKGQRCEGLTGGPAAEAHGPIWDDHLLEPATPPRVTVPPPDTSAAAAVAEVLAAQEAVRRLEAHVDDLRRQLADRARETAQLHTMLAQAYHPAPPSGEDQPSAPPAGGRAAGRWWRRLWGAGLAGGPAPAGRVPLGADDF